MVFFCTYKTGNLSDKIILAVINAGLNLKFSKTPEALSEFLELEFLCS